MFWDTDFWAANFWANDFWYGGSVVPTGPYSTLGEYLRYRERQALRRGGDRIAHKTKDRTEL